MKSPGIFLLSVLILSISFLSAQEQALKRFKLYSAGIATGGLNDTYRKMDLETMRDFTRNPQLMDRNLDAYAEELYRTSEGSFVEMNVSFIPYDAAAGQYNENREIRIGLMYSEREPMIEYIKNEGAGTEDVIYCALVDEITLKAAYLFKARPDWAKKLSYYVGVDLNIGAGIDNQMLIMENVRTEEGFYEYREQFLDTKTSIFTRYSIPLGINYAFFDKVGLGVETSFGTGFQSVMDGKTYWMPFSYTISTRLSYLF